MADWRQQVVRHCQSICLMPMGDVLVGGGPLFFGEVAT